MKGAATRIVLLGRLGIDRGGKPDAGDAGLPGRRSEMVFAYLAAEHRRTVSRDELADALWPDRLPDTWNAALRSVLSDVRRFLERRGIDPAQTLVAEQGGLRFRMPPDAVLDIDEARSSLAVASARMSAGDPAAAAEHAAHAAELSALPFLSHHEGTWVDDKRSELDELHIRALAVQARAHAQAGDPPAAVAAADRLVRADPFLESAHRLRIEMLGAAGDRAGARKAYERCKQMLASELHVEPSPETQAALREALAGHSAPRADTPSGVLSVMVVEDHDFQRRTALTLLRGLGVGDLRDAADGSSALALLETGAAPDVIICDIDMPGMDGVEFIRHVAQRRLASAVAIASALDARLLETVRAASEGYGLQVLGAVSKPLTARSLSDLLAAYRRPPPGAGEGDAGLAAALADGTYAPALEPIVDLALGSITGARAAVSGATLAAADAAGLGRALAEHLLAHAGAAARDAGLETWIPLPPGATTDVAVVDALAAIARDNVVLVVSATEHRRGGPAALDVLARLRVKGFGLCLDDYTPSVERLPLTHVALPAGLVRGDGLAEAMETARRLRIRAVAACADAADFDRLLMHGCDLAAGPFLAPPVTATELGASARGWSAPAANNGAA